MIELKKTVIENAQIIYKHFAGGMSGKPSFCIALDEKLAEEFREGGWPVKTYAKAPDESGHVSERLSSLRLNYISREKEKILHRLWCPRIPVQVRRSVTMQTQFIALTSFGLLMLLQRLDLGIVTLSSIRDGVLL